jgi:energy-coupling factor transporter ATP-binding protein EcfA2
MNLNLILNAFIVWAIVELVTDAVTKTPLWLIKQCFVAYHRFWLETSFLHRIIRNPNFARWKSVRKIPQPSELLKKAWYLIIMTAFVIWLWYLLFTSPLDCIFVFGLYFVISTSIIYNNKKQNQKYVSLNAIKAQETIQETAQPVLNLLIAAIKQRRAVVLLGEPGAGKTTALEALTYRVARNAYIYDLLLWSILIFAALLLIFINPAFSLGWVAFFFLWEPLARRSTIPIYLELRSEYFGESVHEWRSQILHRHMGELSLFNSKSRIVFLLDGVNEIQANSYESFIEGWRAIIRNRQETRVVFSSRINEDPSTRLGIDYKLAVCELDDEGVQQFLHVYGKEKRVYKPEQVEHDFNVLRNKNLLGKESIGRNPYWLRIMVESNLYTRNLGLLFLNFTKKLIFREVEEKPEKGKRKPEWKNVPIEIEMKALSSLALAMHRKQQIGFSDKKGWYMAHEILRSELEGLGYMPEDILREAEASSLLKVQYEKHVVFMHQLVQEFFTAHALQTEDNWKEAAKHSKNMWWSSTLIMLGGLLALNSQQTFNALIKYILRDGTDELRVFTAIKVLGSVDDIPTEMQNLVLDTFVTSLNGNLTEIQSMTVNESERIIEHGLVNYCDSLLHNSEKQNKAKATAILCTIGTEEAAKILLNWLSKTNENNMELLIPIGTPLIELLITALTDSSEYADTKYRRKAAILLKQIGTPAIKSLIAKTESSDEWVSENAKVALAMIKEGLNAS